MAQRAQASPTPNGANLNILDGFSDSMLRGANDQNTDFSFANFDLSDYVSNNDQLDVFGEHTSGGDGSGQPAHGSVNGQTVAMMTEALAHQLQDMHSTGGSLSAQPHQPVPQHQRHAGLSTPHSALHGDGMSSSPALNATSSSGHITPIATHSSSPGVPGDPATELLKEQLSKQLQLQRLQHLQNQLLQQQVRRRRSKQLGRRAHSAFDFNLHHLD